ncbi:hypothetical protein [Flavisericum labens]
MLKIVWALPHHPLQAVQVAGLCIISFFRASKKDAIPIPNALIGQLQAFK